MKKILLFLAMTLISAPAFASHKHVSATVKGMVCGFCAQGIEKKFKADPAVESVKVSLETKLVQLSLRDGQDITDEAVKKVLLDAGYNTDKIERN
ncbi:MAG: heavy-metal-associated domain-containing protein [Bdellovibrionota bacterium]